MTYKKSNCNHKKKLNFYHAHPEYEIFLISVGFSGHGFKFSILVGKILADLVIHGKSESNTSLFKISRFFQVVE